MSDEEFEFQIAAQNNLCPIGNHSFSANRGRGELTPARDHDHENGKNRAILCSAHNRALGMFHDSPEELLAAREYILEWRKKHLDIQS